MSTSSRRLAGSTALTLALALSAAPSALAQGASLNNAHYGGTGSQDFGVQPVTLVLSSDATSVKGFRVTSTYLCPDGGTRVLNEDISIPLASDGSFSRQITFAPLATSTGSVQRSFDLKGKAGLSDASGTFQGTVVVRDTAGNVTETCDSGVVNWTADRMGVAAGRTNQNRSAFLKAELDGKPSEFGVSWLIANCQPGNGSVSFSTLVKTITADKKNRHFTAKGTETIKPPNALALSYTVDYTLAGKLTSKGAKGTFRAVATLKTTSGTVVGDKCDTGELKYTTRLG